MADKQRDRKRQPEAPRRLVKNEEEATRKVSTGESHLDPSKSPLAAYLKVSRVSTTSFAKVLGIEYRTFTSWRDGETVPSIAAAFEIERLSKGAVPMESWLTLPKAKAEILKYRANQPEEMKRMPNRNPPGGFAEPTMTENKGKGHTLIAEDEVRDDDEVEYEEDETNDE